MPPQRVQRLEDLAPVIELYHHTVRAGQYDEAMRLYYDRLWRALYYQFGDYQMEIELLHALFPNGEDKPPRLKDESAQAWTLNELANSYSLSGQPRNAVCTFKLAVELVEKLGSKRNVAAGLGNLASMAQIHIGALRAAEANLRHSIVLGREIEDEFREAVGHAELGRLLAYRGAWEEAEETLAASARYWEQTNDVQGLCVDEAYRALRALLLARWTAITPSPQSPISSIPNALAAARRALKLAEGGDPHISGAVVSRDYVRAHWLLGAAHRASGDTGEADRHLSEALTRCRGINMVDHEADILLELARLRAATGPSTPLRMTGTKPCAWPRKRCSSPSVAATSCKARTCTSSWHRWRWRMGTRRQRWNTPGKRAAWPPATARRTTPTKWPTTRPGHCCSGWRADKRIRPRPSNGNPACKKKRDRQRMHAGGLCAPPLALGSPGRTRTYNQPVTSTPAFPQGTDYLITPRGCGALEGGLLVGLLTT